MRDDTASGDAMNLYTCQIDLKHDAKALAFAQAVTQWMDHQKVAGTIGDRRQ